MQIKSWRRRVTALYWMSFHKNMMEAEIMRSVAVIRGCTGCDTCRWLCKMQAITFDHAGAHVDADKCVGCGVCADNCQSFAITIKPVDKVEEEKEK